MVVLLNNSTALKAKVALLEIVPHSSVIIVTNVPHCHTQSCLTVIIVTNPCKQRRGEI